MLKMLESLLDDNKKQVKKLSRKVEEINNWEEKISSLSDSELQNKTKEFKDRLAKGEKLDALLPEAFAVVRETSKRVLGMRHFEVQLMGGIVLHKGRIAEMKTGEGKTLVATLPAYLNALTGEGVHIVTVNDYLAKRDSEWMGKIYEFLGLEVGLIVHGMDSEERKAAYNADVIYGTNNEFGFDFLRDNMALSKERLVQGSLNYCIIDEVDSILIDEARTPLVISGQADKPTDLYYKIDKIIPRLDKEEDYIIDEKAKVAALTEQGIARVEKMLNIEALYDDENLDLSHHVNQALKAHTLMKKDRDYVVKDDQVIIVDEFTGRLMYGRRFSEGLHQAIEAKEGVKIEKESQTLATITFQNYFRMYKKLAGMTGTAETEEEEFRKIYKMDVVVIPTNEPMIREDHPDVIFRTEKGKFEAAVEEIESCYQRGQPVLVGTVSIEKSEIFSNMLKKKGIPHQVLNAKYHEQEAEIIANAGQKGQVTIATNMAGRGVDIVLGEGVKELGGLHILGTERHESRRIDNQLRGRSGRQGDEGSSRFYVSLEDDLMRLFGSDNIGGMMDKVGMDDSSPIDHGLISRSIERAQKKIETRNFEIRKYILEYDDVLNQQREVIYKQRRQVLEGENLKDTVLNMISELVDDVIESYSAGSQYPEEWDLQSLLNYAEQIFLPENAFEAEQLINMEKEEIKEAFREKALELYSKKEEETESETMRELERYVILRVVDQKWMDHIDAMDQLRQGIGLRAYGQRDPLVEYKAESFDMFNRMIQDIKEDVVRNIFRVKVVREGAQQPRNVQERRHSDQESEKKEPVKQEKKVGRNEPCPCGSKKKYKKCCGK